jgi:hypothetical protein
METFRAVALSSATICERGDMETFRVVALCSPAGRSEMLLQRAPKLFRHVRDVLRDAPALAADYGAVLRNCLLPSRCYCAATPVSVFQGAHVPSAESRAEFSPQGEQSFARAAAFCLWQMWFRQDGLISAMGFEFRRVNKVLPICAGDVETESPPSGEEGVFLSEAPSSVRGVFRRAVLVNFQKYFQGPIPTSPPSLGLFLWSLAHAPYPRDTWATKCQLLQRTR